MPTDGPRLGGRGDASGDDVLAAYLAARAAPDDPAAAARGYAIVLAAALDLVVALRAYRAAMLAGDLDLATRAAAILAAANALPADAAVLLLATAVRQNDTPALTRTTATLAGTRLAFLAPALAVWTRFAADGTVADAASETDPLARRFRDEARALALIAAGRPAEGVAAVAAAPRSAIDQRVAAAQLLFARGDDEGARKLLAGDDPVLARLRAGSPIRPSLGFGVARLLTRVAGDLAGDATLDLRIALTRAALVADPAHDRARLLLADALAASDQPDLALAEIAAVPAASPWSPATGPARVAILAGAGRDAAALAAARPLAEAADASPGAVERYAALLAAAGRPADAAPWYRRLVEGADADNWNSWAAYADALDRAGCWPEASRALARAVALAPDEPLALNNAGYARVEHGEYRAGTRLLERAARLAPDDTSIADSLGWAYFRSGDLARALPLVERAARDQPANAEIADHLGDVYWRLGRRYDARYAWAAARLVAAPAEARALAAKIENGL